jgi:hypothetical protein
MAGHPSHTNTTPSKKSGGSTRENANRSPSAQRKHSVSSGSSQQRDQASETPTSGRKAVSVQLKTSHNKSPDLLFITTGKPANFKDPSVQKEISRHVMKDYQNKQQGKEPILRGKSKQPTRSQSDKETAVGSTRHTTADMSAGESYVRNA